MNVVLLVRSNPEESHRACEGVRIALGLRAGEHTVDLILTDKAPLLLTPDLPEYVDGEMAEKFLTTLKEFIPCFYVASESEIDLSDSDYAIHRISRDEIAQKIAASDALYCF
jgi:hypothetical protein